MFPTLSTTQPTFVFFTYFYPLQPSCRYISSRSAINYILLYAEVESRTQGSRPRPRIQKNPRPRPRTALPKTDPLEAKDSNARGQGPRTQAQVFSKKKVFKKIFQAIYKILTIQKILLSSSRGQVNFRGPEASRPRPRTSKCVLEDSTSGPMLKTFTGQLSHYCSPVPLAIII